MFKTKLGVVAKMGLPDSSKNFHEEEQSVRIVKFRKFTIVLRQTSFIDLSFP